MYDLREQYEDFLGSSEYADWENWRKEEESREKEENSEDDKSEE